jgi:hypothetical protein
VSASLVALVTFVCTFSGALAAMAIRRRLPESHISKESQDVVRLGIGLVATMTALLLGLVTAAARSGFDAQEALIRTSAVNLLTLDRHLARYGPETRGTRDLIRRAIAARVDAVWSSDGGNGTNISAPGGAPPVEEVENQILRLPAETESQRWFKAEALKLSEEVVKARWRALGATSTIPLPFLGVVIFWLTVTFGSFGLFSPQNGTVIVVLAIAAFSVAAAMFLVLELDGPYDGVIKVSSGPLRYALEHLGQ